MNDKLGVRVPAAVKVDLGRAPPNSDRGQLGHAGRRSGRRPVPAPGAGSVRGNARRCADADCGMLAQMSGQMLGPTPDRRRAGCCDGRLLAGACQAPVGERSPRSAREHAVNQAVYPTGSWRCCG